MERVKLDCPNCGSTLNKIETQKDTYVCLHCGHKEIIKKEDMPTNYYINQTITKNIYGNEKLSEEDYYKLVKNAEKYISIEEYRKAVALTNKAKKIDEGNYLAWLLSAKSKLLYNIKNKEEENVVLYYPMSSINKDYNKAYGFAEDGMKGKIEEELQPLIAEYSSYLEDEEDSEPAKPVDLNKAIKTIHIVCSVIAIYFIAIIIVLLCLIEEKDVCASLSVFLGIVFVIWSCVIIDLKRKKKIVEYIKSRDRVAIEELYNLFHHGVITLKYAELSKVAKNEFKRDINQLMERYIFGYKIDGEYVVKYTSTVDK